MPPKPATLAPAAPSQSVVQLIRGHSLLPHPSPSCVDQAADAIKGAGLLGGAAAALLASGTLVPVIGFISASAFFGAALAKYTNCEEDAAKQKPPPTPP